MVVAVVAAILAVQAGAIPAHADPPPTVYDVTASVGRAGLMVYATIAGCPKPTGDRHTGVRWHLDGTDVGSTYSVGHVVSDVFRVAIYPTLDLAPGDYHVTLWCKTMGPGSWDEDVEESPTPIGSIPLTITEPAAKVEIAPAVPRAGGQITVSGPGCQAVGATTRYTSISVFISGSRGYDVESWHYSTSLPLDQAGNWTAFQIALPRDVTDLQAVAICPDGPNTAGTWYQWTGPIPVDIPPVRVAVLGDSYISGEGVGSNGSAYDACTDLHGLGSQPAPCTAQAVTDAERAANPGAKDRNLCHRAQQSWAARIGQELGARGSDLLFAACSGATTDDLLDRAQYPFSPYGVHGGEPQLRTFRNWLEDGAADVVFISIGGNDAGFKDIVTNCATMANCAKPRSSGQPRTLAQTAWEDGLPAVAARAKRVYEQVRQAALAKNPDAQVFVVGYPDTVNPPTSPCLALGLPDAVSGAVDPTVPFDLSMSRQEQQWFHEDLLPKLNNRLLDAAVEAGVNWINWKGPGRDVFQGHNVCAPQPYANGLVRGDDIGLSVAGKRLTAIGNESFHPNADGYAAMTAWVREWLNQGRLGTGNPSPGDPTLPDPSTPVVRPPSLVVQSITNSAPVTLVRSLSERVHLTFNANGLRSALTAARRLVVSTRSVPRDVGTLTVQPDGTAQGDLVLPNWWGPGYHVIEVRIPETGEVVASTLVANDPEGCTALSASDDVDGDGLRNGCDPTNNDGPLADRDGDGVGNEVDLCPTVPDGQIDLDDDGVGDACDTDFGHDPAAGRDQAQLVSDAAAPPLPAPTILSPAAESYTASSNVTIEGTGFAGATVFVLAKGVAMPLGSTTVGLDGRFTIRVALVDGRQELGAAQVLPGRGGFLRPFSFTVDTSAPTVAPMADVTARADGPTGAVVDYAAPTAVDAIDGTVSVACTPPPGSRFPVGASTVTCRAVDRAGNVGVALRRVVVRDERPPVVTVPATVVVDAATPAGATVALPPVTAIDDVDGVVAAACTPRSGSTFRIGDTSVDCSARDAAGNVGRATFIVHVRGAVEQLTSLAALVDGVGPGSSLRNKVSTIAAALAGGRTQDALSGLSAFVSEVRAQTGKHVPATLATRIIDAATRMTKVLGGP